MPPTPATRADHLEHMLRRASAQPSSLRVASRFAARALPPGVILIENLPELGSNTRLVFRPRGSDLLQSEDDPGYYLDAGGLLKKLFGAEETSIYGLAKAKARLEKLKGRMAALVEGGIDETTDLGKTLKQVGVLVTSTGEAKVDVTQALVTNLTNFLAPMGWTKDKDAYEKGPIEMAGVYYWTWKGPNGEVLTLKGIRSAQQAIPGTFSLAVKKASARVACLPGDCKCGGCECSNEEAMLAPDACSAARVARRFAFGMGPFAPTEGSSYNPIAERGPYRPGTCSQVIEGDIISIKHNGPKVMSIREISAPNLGWILFEGYLLDPRTGQELKHLEIEVKGEDPVQIKRDR